MNLNLFAESNCLGGHRNLLHTVAVIAVQTPPRMATAVRPLNGDLPSRHLVVRNADGSARICSADLPGLKGYSSQQDRPREAWNQVTVSSGAGTQATVSCGAGTQAQFTAITGLIFPSEERTPLQDAWSSSSAASSSCASDLDRLDSAPYQLPQPLASSSILPPPQQPACPWPSRVPSPPLCAAQRAPSGPPSTAAAATAAAGSIQDTVDPVGLESTVPVGASEAPSAPPACTGILSEVPKFPSSAEMLFRRASGPFTGYPVVRRARSSWQTNR